MYYAHSSSSADRSNWHRLSDHLQATARLAKQYGDLFGIGPAAHLAGLMHDLGKYTPQFQARLGGSGEQVDHSTAGAAIVAGLARGDDKFVAELIAYAIAGHHSGLADKHGASLSTLSERLRRFTPASLDHAWKQEICPETAGLLPAFTRNCAKDRLPFHFAFLGRMIFSCLVDADFKDTEAFYAQVEARQLDRNWPALPTILDSLRSSFDQHLNRLRSADTMVNRVRSDVLDHVRSHAREAPGFFTLTVPTGGGKTLASLGFALDHARAHGHRRIIYAIPFTAIIDQTAATFKKVLGDDVVLEHHSAIEEEFRGKGRERKDKLKLAMEDWAAAVVVTTNVQLFESLFANRPSRCRKLHNIAGSILILDEAQTLPLPLLAPAVWALKTLVDDYGCTIVLCTATQPALDARHFPIGHVLGLPLAGRELAPDPIGLAKRLVRVRIRDAGEVDDTALVEALEREEQGLVIVNTRGHALALYRAAREQGLEGLVHLTTRQYAAHRREILAEVTRRLKKQQPCRLIATSLIEAGIDLDFPKVWRAEAGLDQIAQAAGRCNREGRRGVEPSVVTIFSPPDHPPPPEIKGFSGDMRRIFHQHDDLLSPAAIADFFGEVYWRVGKEGVDRKGILEDFRMSAGSTDFAYRTVAEKFQMIESRMVPVIIPRAPEAKTALAKLTVDRIPSGAIARDLQPYTVQIPLRARSLLLAAGHVGFAEPMIRGEQFAVLRYDQLYDDEVGLLWEAPEYLSVENAII
jgi:CRISPR-associated endonuclease/helicase Cas3